LSIGTYSVTVTDANGCSATATVTITQPAALVATISATNVACNGDATGAANLSVSGGTTPYTYNWGSGVTTEDRTGLTAGTYTVTITDANGCSATATVTITQPTVLTVNAVATFDCIQNSGQVIVTAQGGVPPYIGTDTFYVNAEGPFPFNVVDAAGCTKTDTVVVNGGTPSIPGNITGLDLLCDSLVAGFVKYEVDSLPGISYYDWEVPQGMSIVTGQGTFKIFVALDGTFTNGYIVVTGNTVCGLTTPDSFYVDIIPAMPQFTVAPQCGYFDQRQIFAVNQN
jgi:hypothetical protein